MNEFEKLQHQRMIEAKQKKCLLCTAILSQKKSRVKDYYDAMLNKSINIPVIVKVLEDWGIAASETVVSNHRAGRKSYGDHMEEIRKATL